jgi:hypothetical protein
MLHFLQLRFIASMKQQNDYIDFFPHASNVRDSPLNLSTELEVRLNDRRKLWPRNWKEKLH